ncbi:MAG TPA: type 1 glutamine amidotransferase [Methanoregula sp.]|nr:type 1 glutamine amidotransferase [Methanoregula sp.]
MITILQHGEDESAGTIPGYLRMHGIPFRTLRLFEGDALPDTLPEKLIILGGQMSVNDAGRYPYLEDEKALARKMILGDRPVLGICLGAQMIASAFGEEVRKGVREIGWKKARGCRPEWRRIFPAWFDVFHWHEETFNLPAGSTLLVRGDTVENQAFRLGSGVGVQFHPEVTEKIISSWAKTHPAGRGAGFPEGSLTRIGDNRTRCHALVESFARGWVL